MLLESVLPCRPIKNAAIMRLRYLTISLIQPARCYPLNRVTYKCSKKVQNGENMLSEQLLLGYLWFAFFMVFSGCRWKSLSTIRRKRKSIGLILWRKKRRMIGRDVERGGCRKDMRLSMGDIRKYFFDFKLILNLLHDYNFFYFFKDFFQIIFNL